MGVHLAGALALVAASAVTFLGTTPPARAARLVFPGVSPAGAAGAAGAVGAVGEISLEASTRTVTEPITRFSLSLTSPARQTASFTMRVDSTSAGELLEDTLDRTAFESLTVRLDNRAGDLSLRFNRPSIMTHLLQASGSGRSVEISISFSPPVVFVSKGVTTASVATTTTTTAAPIIVAEPSPPVPVGTTSTTSSTTTTVPSTTTSTMAATTTTLPACEPVTATSTTVDPPPCDLYGVSFSGEDGWAVGEDGTILATSDGGSSWAPETGAPAGGETLRAVYSDPSTGEAWAVGDGGTVLSTTNGSTWTAEDSGTSADLYGVAFSGPYGVAVGASGTVLTTTDDGADWALTSAGSTVNLNAVAFTGLSGPVAEAVGDGGTVLEVTYNAATASWDVSPVPSGVSQDLYGVAFYDSYGDGIIVGSGGALLEGGGDYWNVETGAPDVDLRGAAGGNFEEAVVGGDGNGAVWAPTCADQAEVDQGVTAEQLNAVALVGPSDDQFVAVGDGGTVLSGTPPLLAC